MKIIKEGKEREFRFFCDCGCVWEAKEYEVMAAFDVYNRHKVEICKICRCPYCGRIKKGVEI